MLKKMIIAVALTAVTLPAYAQEVPEAIKSAGKVVVLNQPSYAPMEYKDPATGKLMGLDIDLQHALAKTMGIKVEWTESTFEQLIPSLITGRGNLIHSGMSDLPKRRDNLDFVDYMKSGAQFFTTTARKDEFKSPLDFCGKRVGMPKSTSFPSEIAQWSAEACKAAGKPAVIVMGNEGSSDTFSHLKQGRIDGGVQGSETLPYLMSENGGNFWKVGAPVTNVFQGMGFLKKDSALRDAYTAALKKLMASGEYNAIFAKWNQQDNALDGVYVNGETVK